MTGRILARMPIAAIVFSLVMLTFGCSNNGLTIRDSETTEGYKVLTVQNKICGFSFEFPAYCEIAGPYIEDSERFKFSYATLLWPKQHTLAFIPDPSLGESSTQQVEYVPASIEVTAYDSSKHPESAEERVESIMYAKSRSPEFELHERSTITVCGVSAELIAYSDEWFFLSLKTEDGNPILEYVRGVYFNYAGLRWEIEARSREDMVDQVKADFENILGTFEILEPVT